MFSKDRRGLAGPSLTQFGMWILLEEIVHIYLSPSQEKLGLVTAQQKAIYETHDANDVVNKLTPAQTLLNAHSYCLYVASMFRFSTVALQLVTDDHLLTLVSRHIRRMHRFPQPVWLSTAGT